MSNQDSQAELTRYHYDRHLAVVAEDWKKVDAIDRDFLASIQKAVTEARIDEWSRQTKDNAFDKPITPENQNDQTWQGGYNFARNRWKRKKLERIAELTKQNERNQ